MEDLPKELLIKIIEKSGSSNYFKHNSNMHRPRSVTSETYVPVLSLKTEPLLPGVYKIGFSCVVSYHAGISIMVNDVQVNNIRNQAVGIATGFNIISVEESKELTISMQCCSPKRNYLQISEMQLTIHRI